MTQDLLKYMVENAEGWKWYGDQVICNPVTAPSGISYSERDIIKDPVTSPILYPLLLTRACEGLGIYVMDEEGEWFPGNIASDNEIYFTSGAYPTPDEAKLAGIKAKMGDEVSEICFDDFDYDRVRCPWCGAEFDESEIEGMGKCPECGEKIN